MVLLTGATGFVGAHVAEGLREEAYRVLTMDRGRRPGGANAVIWDFDGKLPPGLPSEIDVIIHCASPVGMGSESHRAACQRANVSATERLLEYGQSAGASTFVFASSGAVYGLASHARHEDESLAPESDYAQSKAAGEQVVMARAREFRVLCLRLFYPYGPGQELPRLVPRLVSSILRGMPIELNGREGRPRMNPIYVDDLVKWIKSLLQAQGAAGVFNLGGLETVSVRQLAETLGQLLRRRVHFNCGGSIPGDTIGDTRLASRAAGFSPEWTLERGLGEVARCAVR